MKYANYKFKTLTLVERETCPKDCIHWDDCYGNNMPFAHRFSAEDQNLLQKRIYEDLLNSLFNKGVFEGVAVIIKSQVAAISSGDLAFSKFHPKNDMSFI